MKDAMFKQKLDSCKKLLQLQNTAMTNILEKRLVFEHLDEIIKTNSDLHTYNLFWDWFFYNYIDSQVMELTRILDKDSDTKNVIRFIDSLIEGFKIDNSFFERIRDMLVSASLSKEMVFLFDVKQLEKDREELINEISIESVRNYRDWKVAHNDAQKWKDLTLDISKLNECINFVHKKILDYELRLNNVGYPITGLLPKIQYDWRSIFRIPWVK